MACKLNEDDSGVPGGTIKEYNSWILQHIIEPAPIKGWLILKTKRHVDGIENMNKKEAGELGNIIESLTKILKEVTKASKVYVCCFTEYVSHLHIHIIPKYQDIIQKGPNIFKLLRDVKEGKIKSVNIKDVANISDILKIKLN